MHTLSKDANESQGFLLRLFKPFNTLSDYFLMWIPQTLPIRLLQSYQWQSSLIMQHITADLNRAFPCQCGPFLAEGPLLILHNEPIWYGGQWETCERLGNKKLPILQPELLNERCRNTDLWQKSISADAGKESDYGTYCSKALLHKWADQSHDLWKIMMTGFIKTNVSWPALTHMTICSGWSGNTLVSTHPLPTWWTYVNLT